ncbi:phenylalanine--tRNA ligase beta subunit-related protein, partial [Duncaniella freteri]
MDIRIEDTIRQAAPGLLVVAIEADVTNGETSEELWALLNRAAADIRDITELPDINRRPGIRATRDAYKALGKEPNRYRPSAEALCRRVVKGMELYRINALVDLINLVSLLSGYSIGGFDADRIQGEVLSLGVGREGEPFETIGRGVLNIACMPVYRDSIGGIGT